MCGISGWIGFQHDLRHQRDRLQEMDETMTCRGPDAHGSWVDTHAALAHRRLAIIDLPGGSQPMTMQVDGGTLAMTYSGEVYNYRELRSQLRSAGHRFATDSDTEVVLHAYAEWGAEFAEHLNGMYAFAIWDGRTEELLLVRDRLGIKPLYYYPTADGLLFGSEPKAILAHPLVEPVLDADGLRQIFAFDKVPGSGVWQGMREVRPGTIVRTSRQGLRIHRYWQLQARPHSESSEETVQRVRELLTDTVERQLISDVPRCMLLSGGLDSSALTSWAAEQLGTSGETVRSFAVDFVGQTENFQPDLMRDTPDGPYVHDVARHWGTRHEDIVLDPETLADPDIRRACVRARDLPNGFGDMDMSLYLLFQAIRQHSTVALSGESADEVFGGYRWFHQPEAVHSGTFPWMAANIHSFEPSLLAPDLDLGLGEYVQQSYSDALAEVPRLEGESAAERRMREVSYLHLTRFVCQLLDRKDRMSMAVGLEVRVPFCDHRLVEYVFNTPWSMKTFDGHEKSLLRGAASSVLPQSVIDRRKSPYPSTQDLGYVRALQRQSADALAEPGSRVGELLNTTAMARTATLPAEQVSDAQRNGMERLLNLHHWFDIYRPTLKVH